MKSSNPKKKSHNDKFYTKKEIAISLLKDINLEQFELIIEPSAGDGSFSKNIKNCVAFDIEPEDESVVKIDFLCFKYDGDIKREKILTIGNPPFGKQSSLVIKFFRKATEFCDNIAFIMPKSFKKESMKQKIPKTYFLQYEKEIPQNSFLLNGEEYNVPSIFQYWKNEYREREKKEKIKHEKWYFYCKREEADIGIRRVGVYSGKAFLECSDKSTESHYFIKLNMQNKKHEFVHFINNIVWEHNNTIGPRSISKNELNQSLIQFFIS